MMHPKVPAESAGKPIRCKAAIARKPFQDLVIEEIEVAPPKAWEVRIKILCTSLCYRDVDMWKLKEGPKSFFPRILGHEAAGIVESVGENVTEVETLDFVIPVFQRNCGKCKDCKSSKGNYCSIFSEEFYGGMPRDGTTRFTDSKGEKLYHSFSVSSFTEYTVVDICHVVKMSTRIPADIACLFSCGVSTGIGVACKFAKVEEGSTVAIFGLGTIGLAVAKGAKLCGASKVIGVELNNPDIDVAKKFGVTDFINPMADLPDDPNALSQVINKMTDGGADYCFECVFGLESFVKDAFACSRKGGGKTVVLLEEKHSSSISVNLCDLLEGKCIMGCSFGGIKPKSDISILTQKYLSKELNLEDFITHQLKFEDINTAIERIQRGHCICCILWMDDKFK